MFSYFRSLPERDLNHRRRFVVVATTVSFLGVVVLWVLFVLIGRKVSPKAGEEFPSPTVEPEATTEPLASPEDNSFFLPSSPSVAPLVISPPVPGADTLFVSPAPSGSAASPSPSEPAGAL